MTYDGASAIFVIHEAAAVRATIQGARHAAMDVDGFAVGDRDQPRLDVASGGQVWVGLHRGQECLRPRIVSVYRAEDGPADAQHGCPVRGDDGLEWLLVCHTL